MAHLTTMVKREPSTLEVQVARIVRIITAIAASKLSNSTNHLDMIGVQQNC
ncbi:MAG: hypothetical protein SAK29_14230 [Scytonema sp. PMC 1069.18]|nr:hypothetical protein [Scytonema sp. PMC 1069.18]MEC4881550.1 hypothetical protein [Scytonema sp. PMC 1070.18]